MKTAAKVDANQAEIVNALRAVGAQVQSLAAVGHGVPDLLVAFRGDWYVAEVKDGSKPPSKRTLTPDEVAWHGKFGWCATVWIWNSADEALEAIGAT